MRIGCIGTNIHHATLEKDIITSDTKIRVLFARAKQTLEIGLPKKMILVNINLK